MLARPVAVCALSGADLEQLEAMGAEYSAGLVERLRSIRNGLRQVCWDAIAGDDGALASCEGRAGYASPGVAPARRVANGPATS